MRPAWSAAMITPRDDHPAPLLRSEIILEAGHGAVIEARWLISALGVFEAYLAGEPVSADVLSPGWSAYEWRLRYREYDVADQIRNIQGPVVLGIALGNGWYRGTLTWFETAALYGNRLGTIAELHITFADGHRQRVVTDRTWTAGPSAVLDNDLYNGQTIDSRLQSTNWLQPGFTDTRWAGVETIDFDTDRLVPYVGPPVVRHEQITPTAIWTSPSGKTLVDFGQNLVGWLKIRLRGEAGHTVTVRHAEVLAGGELALRPLRTARAIDQFILSGGDDVFEPTFTFHGFRYAEITGWPGELRTNHLAADDLVAVVVSSDLSRIGEFACSDPMLNQLHTNAVWGLRGNFLDLPTDCPQRDERLGWTGDIAVFAPTAAFLFDVKTFLQDWLLDLAAEQTHADGVVPFVVPNALKYTQAQQGFPRDAPAAIWADAAVWVPWALWQAYGDIDMLAAAYPAMVAHLRRVENQLSPTGLWDTGFQFGDWLDPDAPPKHPGWAKADPGVVATACLYRSSVIVAAAARALGLTANVDYFTTLAENTRAAFTRHYVDADGTIRSDCTTVYTLAIAFGLLDEPLLSAAGDRLADLVAQAGHRITTGFAGTPYICDALTQTGHLDTAYRLLLQQDCPSWLYPVTMGATTIWERWNSMLPDGSINPGEMTSFNHYALGAVADWMHRTIAGLSPAEPGYRRIRIAPRPGPGIDWARSSLQTPHGLVSVEWHTGPGGALRVDVELPAHVAADIALPDAETVTVVGGRHTLTSHATASAGSVH